MKRPRNWTIFQYKFILQLLTLFSFIKDIRICILIDKMNSRVEGTRELYRIF